MEKEVLFVCGKCFDDQGVRRFIEHNWTHHTCSFCGNISSAAIAASIEDVADHIAKCPYQEYDDAVNQLGFASEMGGYIGLHWDTYELLFDIGLNLPYDSDSKLLYILIDLLPQHTWCERNAYGPNDQERIALSWRHFCDVIMHSRRFFFADYNPKRLDRDFDSPSEVLFKLFAYAQSYDLLVQLSVGTQLYRARRQRCSEEFSTARDLGPPPRKLAIQANRMSPPGIVMFYASDHPKTALREIAVCPGPFAVGRFETTQPTSVLDLTMIPPIPSLFEEVPDRVERRPREVLTFLNHVASEISKPIKRDGRAHVEYVPTQVVTEYVRSQVMWGGGCVNGIKYPSTVDPGHDSYVLFADQNHIEGGQKEPRSILGGESESKFLRLTTRSEHLVSSVDICRWRSRASPTRPSEEVADP